MNNPNPEPNGRTGPDVEKNDSQYPDEYFSLRDMMYVAWYEGWKRGQNVEELSKVAEDTLYSQFCRWWDMNFGDDTSLIVYSEEEFNVMEKLADETPKFEEL